MGQAVQVQEVGWNLQFKVHLGETWGRFMEGLSERRILATSCDRCGRTFVPPQPFCETCFEPATTWTELSGLGRLQSWTVSEHEFLGSPAAPYAIGAIQLDGADTMLIHFLGGVDLGDVDQALRRFVVGDPVQAVWAENRKGHIHDIAYFAPVQ